MLPSKPLNFHLNWLNHLCIDILWIYSTFFGRILDIYLFFPLLNTVNHTVIECVQSINNISNIYIQIQKFEKQMCKKFQEQLNGNECLPKFTLIWYFIRDFYSLAAMGSKTMTWLAAVFFSRLLVFIANICRMI